MTTTDPKARRRYYLHSKIKRFCEVPALRRTCLIHPERESILSAKEREWVNALRAIGYSFQYTMITKD